MVADGRLTETEGLSEVAHTRLAVGLCIDEAEEAKAGWIGEHLESRSKLLRLSGLDGLL